MRTAGREKIGDGEKFNFGSFRPPGETAEHLAAASGQAPPCLRALEAAGPSLRRRAAFEFSAEAVGVGHRDTRHRLGECGEFSFY